MIVVNFGICFAVNSHADFIGSIQLDREADFADRLVVTQEGKPDAGILDVRRFYYDTDARQYRATSKGFRMRNEDVPGLIKLLSDSRA